MQRKLPCFRRGNHHSARFPHFPFLSITFLAVTASLLCSYGICTALLSAPVPRGRHRALPMFGNFLSGITGIPPPTLLDVAWENDLVRLTSLENVNLECAYKASRDGWSAINFHQGVDERGSGMVVALSRSGVIFGGFNPVGWRSTDDYSSSNSAFLWFLKGNKVIKCPVLTGGMYYNIAAAFPCF